MKKESYLLLSLIFFLFLNCLEYNEKIVINKDGSGTIKISYSGPSDSEVDSDNSKYIFLKGDEYDIKENIERYYTSRRVKLEDFYYERSGINKYIDFVLKFEDIDDLEDVTNFKGGKIKFEKDRDGEYNFERTFDVDGERDFYKNDSSFEKFLKNTIREGVLDKIKFEFECRLPREIRISNSEYIRGDNVAKWYFTLGDVVDKKEYTMWCKLK